MGGEDFPFLTEDPYIPSVISQLVEPEAAIEEAKMEVGQCRRTIRRSFRSTPSQPLPQA